MLQRRHSQSTIRVVNAGVPWHTTMHSLLRYVARFSDWQPDVVIVMHAFNDIYQASEGRLTSGTFRQDYGHFWGPLALRVKPRERLNENLRRALMDNRLSRDWYSDFREARPSAPKKTVNLLAALPSFQRNLTQLVYRAKQDGARVILVTQPYLYRHDMPESERKLLIYPFYYRDHATVPTVKEQEKAMKAFNAATRQIAAMEQVVLVNVDVAMPKSTEYMFDDVHYTPQGARFVARLVMEALPWGELN